MTFDKLFICELLSSSTVIALYLRIWLIREFLCWQLTVLVLWLFWFFVVVILFLVHFVSLSHMPWNDLWRLECCVYMCSCWCSLWVYLRCTFTVAVCFDLRLTFATNFQCCTFEPQLHLRGAGNFTCVLLRVCDGQRLFELHYNSVLVSL